MALEAGCRLVQLRIKDQPLDEVRSEALAAQLLCQKFGAKLIINDYPSIAREVDAYGCHLGLTDMPIAQARSLVGTQMILGGTANTLSDVLQRIQEGVDYVGLGPLRHTNTKKVLSPHLGFSGYASILANLGKRARQIPILAIGGVNTDDILKLKTLGVYGIALSSAILEAENRTQTVQQIKAKLC